MKPVLVLIAASLAGTALNVWWLSGFVPEFLLPDAAFLAVVYAGLFVEGPLGFLAALAAAVLREATVPAPGWTFFLSSLSLYFLSREIGRRLFVRTEFFVLVTTLFLLLLESVTVTVLCLLAGSDSFTLVWAAEESVRIAWTSLVAVPLFMHLSGRWREVSE